MIPSVEKRLLTVAEYHQMAEAGILRPEDRLELIEGELFYMSPVNSLHASHVKKINVLLNRLFGNHLLVGVQYPIHIDDYTEPGPDLCLLDFRDDFYQKAHPRADDVILLIEVSDSSLEFDLGRKKTLYAQAGIPQYWVINLVEHCVEVFSEPDKATYKLHRRAFPGDEIPSPIEGPALSVEDVLIGKPKK